MGPEDVFHDPSGYLGLPAVGRQHRVVHLWAMAAFSAPVSHTVYAVDRGFLVRRVILHPAPFQGEDQPWGADGRPDTAAVRALIGDLRALELAPFARDEQTGRDGTRYGVEAGDVWRSARLSWWDTQSGWEALLDWHQRATTLLDGCLPPHRAPGRA